MNATSDRPKPIHQGCNVKKFREIMGMKQETLAIALGDDWTQKRVSLLDSKEVIEASILRQVAEVLRVPEEAIKNLDEDKAVNIIANTFSDGSVALPNVINATSTPWNAGSNHSKRSKNSIPRIKRFTNVY